MIIFGGILELTKELNEMLLFNFQTETFTLIGGENHDNMHHDHHNSPRRNNEENQESPI